MPSKLSVTGDIITIMEIMQRYVVQFLVVRQITRSNPAHSVRGPKYVVKKGKTPVWSREDAKTLLVKNGTMASDLGLLFRGPSASQGGGTEALLLS